MIERAAQAALAIRALLETFLDPATNPPGFADILCVN